MPLCATNPLVEAGAGGPPSRFLSQKPCEQNSGANLIRALERWISIRTFQPFGEPARRNSSTKIPSIKHSTKFCEVPARCQHRLRRDHGSPPAPSRVPALDRRSSEIGSGDLFGSPTRLSAAFDEPRCHESGSTDRTSSVDDASKIRLSTRTQVDCVKFTPGGIHHFCRTSSRDSGQLPRSNRDGSRVQTRNARRAIGQALAGSDHFCPSVTAGAPRMTGELPPNLLHQTSDFRPTPPATSHQPLAIG